MYKKLINIDEKLKELELEEFELDSVYYNGEIVVCKTLEIAQRLYNISNDDQKKKLDEVMFNKLKELTNFGDKIVDKMLVSYKNDLFESSPVDIFISGEEVIFKNLSLNDGFIESIDYIFRGKRIFINEEEVISLNSLIKDRSRKLVKYE